MHFVPNRLEAQIPFREALECAGVPASLWKQPSIDRTQTVIARSIAAPNHGHRSRKAAAHVKREEFSHVFDLACTRLPRELLIFFNDLANSGRADGMTIADQTAACVHRNLECRSGSFSAPLRERCRAAFH